MTMTPVAKRTSARDFDARSAARATSLGSLVDDVVSDLIRAEAGISPLAESRSANRMGQLLHDAIENAGRSTAVWAPDPLGDTLRRLVPAEGRASVEAETSSADGDGLLRQISTDLDDAISGDVDAARIALLRRRMTLLADLTLDNASYLLAPQPAPSSWSVR